VNSRIGGRSPRTSVEGLPRLVIESDNRRRSIGMPLYTQVRLTSDITGGRFKGGGSIEESAQPMTVRAVER